MTTPSVVLNSDGKTKKTRNQEKKKQAGAELCQAQFKLGLNKPALPGVTKNMDVFLLPKN